MRERHVFGHRSNSDIKNDTLQKSITELEVPKVAEEIIKLLIGANDEQERNTENT